MANITGTVGNDPALNGTADDDIITALGGNDVVNAGSGNDIIYGGLGNDTLNGDDGDDLFIEDEFTTPNDIFNGGSGIDTIELRVAPVPVQISIGSLTPHSFTGANSLNSIERLVYASTPGQIVQASVTYAYATSGVLTEIVAGAGRDILAFGGGTAAATYTMPNLNLVGWDAAPLNAWEATGDLVSLTGSTLNDTINAAAGVSFLQVLVGGTGDDTVNGSANGDIVNATSGADIVNAAGGNDSIQIVNQAQATGSGWLPPTTFSGAGGVWNGGDGTDVVSIGGAVDLQATLLNIEGVQLLAGFFPLQPFVARQETAYLRLDAAHIAMLPGNAFFTGTGTVDFVLADGASFDTSTYSITAGSAVDFVIQAGSGNGLIFTGNSGNDTIILGFGTQIAIGGNGNDMIQFGLGTQTGTGGAGADLFGFGIGAGTVTDFTQGEDKIDLSNSEVFNLSRLNDILTLYSSGATISVNTVDDANQPQTHQMTLQGVAIASLTASDFLLGTDTGGNDIEIGTAAAEFFAGGSGNDEYHGGDGADRLYGGGGINSIFGDGGDDTIILDGVIGFGGTYDGGTGTDTLLLRANSASVANGPATQYFIFPGAPGTGLVSVERIAFDSSASYALTFVTTAAPGITEAIGGAGADVLVFVAQAAGTFTMPSFTLTNWSANDAVVLSAQTATAFDVTFNGRNDIGQVLIGQGGNDTLNGGALADTLRGGTGNDALTGNGGADFLYGEAGNDRLVVSTNGVSVDGGTETDTLAITGTVSAFASLSNLEAIELVGGASLTLSAAQFNTGFYNPIAQVGMATVSGSGSLVFNIDLNPITAALYLASLSFAGGSSVTVTINGSNGLDAIKGAPGVSNTINGGDEADQIRGGSLADTIDGGNGNDKLFGWSGADTLTGGAGSDQFRYFFATDSGLGAAADRITDFQIGTDKFNFVIIDADPVTPDDQAFAFIGTGAFTSPGTGQIRYQDSGADLLVQVDVDGNGTVDMEVVLQGLAGQALTSADFML